MNLSGTGNTTRWKYSTSVFLWWQLLTFLKENKIIIKLHGIGDKILFPLFSRLSLILGALKKIKVSNCFKSHMLTTITLHLGAKTAFMLYLKSS